VSKAGLTDYGTFRDAICDLCNALTQMCPEGQQDSRIEQVKEFASQKRLNNVITSFCDILDDLLHGKDASASVTKTKEYIDNARSICTNFQPDFGKAICSLCNALTWFSQQATP
jgi:hypothetical protein